MGLIGNIQQDAQRITTDLSGFAVPILFSITNGETVVSKQCKGTAFKHHLSISEQGTVVNSRNARVTISELELIAQGFPVRDSNNRVALKNCMVTWTDISGIQATYTIREQYPNEVTGLIVCQLGEYGTISPPGRTIIGWIVSPFTVEVKTSPDTAITQTLANGDVIPVEYALNTNGTLTIPYLAGYPVLTPFMLDGSPMQSMPYDRATGTFDNSANGGFYPDVNLIAFNASIPVWDE